MGTSADEDDNLDFTFGISSTISAWANRSNVARQRAMDRARVHRLYCELLTKPTSPADRREARALAPLIRKLGLSRSDERFLLEFPDSAEPWRVTDVEIARASYEAFSGESDQGTAELKLKEQERQRLTRELDRVLLATSVPPE